MRRAVWLALLIGFSLTGPASGEGPGGTPELAIDAEPVDIAPGELSGLRLRGTQILSADHPEFGGFSGLLMSGPRLIAVTDRGWWLLAELEDGPNGLRPRNAGFSAMRDPDGQPYGGKRGDAEALAVREGVLMVAFERDHRVMFHEGEGRLGEAIRDPRFDAMPGNGGIEALATTPDGWVLMFGEEAEDGNHPLFLLRWSGEIEARSFPKIERHEITGADTGPDGWLYLLLRDYSVIAGVSIRIHRYDLDEDGWPVIASRQVLAEFESVSGIDNMEGIALWQDAAGRTRLTLISDDNFNAVQRTLLMDFQVLE